MFTYIWAVLTCRHSFREFMFVHTAELLLLGCFGIFFYGATFVYSLIQWP